VALNNFRIDSGISDVGLRFPESLRRVQVTSDPVKIPGIREVILYPFAHHAFLAIVGYGADLVAQQFGGRILHLVASRIHAVDLGLLSTRALHNPIVDSRAFIPGKHHLQIIGQRKSDALRTIQSCVKIQVSGILSLGIHDGQTLFSGVVTDQENCGKMGELSSGVFGEISVFSHIALINT